MCHVPRATCHVPRATCHALRPSAPCSQKVMAFVVSLVSHSKHHLSLVSFGQLGPHRNLDLGSTRDEAECLGSEASTLSRTRVKVEATVGLVQVSISWAKSWATVGCVLQQEQLQFKQICLGCLLQMACETQSTMRIS